MLFSKFFTLVVPMVSNKYEYLVDKINLFSCLQYLHTLWSRFYVKSVTMIFFLTATMSIKDKRHIMPSTNKGFNVIMLFLSLSSSNLQDSLSKMKKINARICEAFNKKKLIKSSHKHKYSF